MLLVAVVLLVAFLVRAVMMVMMVMLVMMRRRLRRPHGCSGEGRRKGESGLARPSSWNRSSRGLLSYFSETPGTAKRLSALCPGPEERQFAER